MAVNCTIQKRWYEWIQCSKFKDSSHIPSTKYVPRFLALKTSRYISTYPRILLEIWNNLCLTGFSFGTTPNIQHCWRTRSSFLPPVCLRQPDGRRTHFQYNFYRRHGLAQFLPPKLDAVCHRTQKMSIDIVTLNKTVTNGEARQINWRPRRRNGRIQ